MPRFFERRRPSDLAALLLAVFLAVSIADINDYHTIYRVMRSPVATSLSLGVTAELSSSPSDSGTDSEHACACLLCTAALPDALGIRAHPPAAEKMPAPFAATIALTPHPPEIFRPPSA